MVVEPGGQGQSGQFDSLMGLPGAPMDHLGLAHTQPVDRLGQGIGVTVAFVAYTRFNREARAIHTQAIRAASHEPFEIIEEMLESC